MNQHEAERIAGALHVARPDWPAASVLTLIRKHLMDRPRRDVFVALAWIASEPNSSTPARVLETGPWWIATAVDGQSTGRREPFDPTRFCGICNKPNDARHPDDHDYESVVDERRKSEPDRTLVTTRVQRMRESIGDAKAEREPEPDRPPLPSLPEVDRLRAELPKPTPAACEHRDDDVPCGQPAPHVSLDRRTPLCDGHRETAPTEEMSA